jgi:hypothetical protein
MTDKQGEQDDLDLDPTTIEDLEPDEETADDARGGNSAVGCVPTQGRITACGCPTLGCVKRG